MNRKQQEEEFIHFDSCVSDLNDAWQILKLIKRRKLNSLRFAAFKFALIAYARPYKISYGMVKSKHEPLGNAHIPQEHLELHKRILAARDQILAHSDLGVKDAQLYVSEHSWGKFAGIVQNVIHGTEELPNIDGIIDLIEKTLNSLYKKRSDLEADLEPNFRTT